MGALGPFQFACQDDTDCRLIAYLDNPKCSSSQSKFRQRTLLLSVQLWKKTILDACVYNFWKHMRFTGLTVFLWEHLVIGYNCYKGGFWQLEPDRSTSNIKTRTSYLNINKTIILLFVISVAFCHVSCGPIKMQKTRLKRAVFEAKFSEKQADLAPLVSVQMVPCLISEMNT